MNAMTTNPSISVEVTSGGMDPDGHETFTVGFMGDPIGEEPQLKVEAKARAIWFGDKVVFIAVDSAKFVRVPEDNRVELLLMVPKAIMRLRHIRGEMVAVFSDELVEQIAYLREISISTESIEAMRMALPNYIEEADQNLVKRGYYFHPMEVPPPEPVAAPALIPPRPGLSVGPEGTVAPGFQKNPPDIAGGPNPVDATAAPVGGRASVVAPGFAKTVADIAGGAHPVNAHVEEVVAQVSQALGTGEVEEEEEEPVATEVLKQMKIASNETQLMMVGASESALGEAITVDFRYKTNSGKFEILAIDSMQTIGVDLDTALGLAFAALRLTKRFNPELPVEMGMTKAGCEEMCAHIEDLEPNTKWNSHLNVHLIDAEYVSTKIAAATELGYVAAFGD